MKKSARRSVCLAGVVLSAAVLGGLSGCAGSSDRDYRKARSNMTPELLTLYQRPVDHDTMVGITFNTNMRAAWEDLSRAMLLNRPSRLTVEPMPH